MEDWLATIESTMLEEKTDYRLKAEANLNFESAPAGENPLNLLKNIASQFSVTLVKVMLQTHIVAGCCYLLVPDGLLTIYDRDENFG